MEEVRIESVDYGLCTRHIVAVQSEIQQPTIIIL